MRSYEDLDARNGMNRAPRSSRDIIMRSFENQLMGVRTRIEVKKSEECFIIKLNLKS